jgi:hypothetical protein
MCDGSGIYFMKGIWSIWGIRFRLLRLLFDPDVVDMEPIRLIWGWYIRSKR